MASKIYHNVYKPWDGTAGALAAAGDAEGDDIRTSEWFDVEGWTDKVIAWEIDSDGTVDANVTIHISSQSAYELNNQTADTDDYVAVTIVDATTTKVYTRKDTSDVDDLQRPIRALRVVIENDETEPVTGFTVWVEGWS